MRISLSNIKLAEDYLFDRLPPGDALLFEANMLLSTDLHDDLRHQQNTYTIVHQYSRRKLKSEIAAVQLKLATETQHLSFINRIINLFKKD